MPPLPITLATSGGPSDPLSDDDDRDRLRRLEERIAAAKAAQDRPARKDEGQYSAAGLAWRMVTELVAGMGIGLLIGLGLDALLGTQPIMLVIFVGFGFAAGIRVMMRTAAEVGQGASVASAAPETDRARREAGDGDKSPGGGPGADDERSGDGPDGMKGG